NVGASAGGGAGSTASSGPSTSNVRAVDVADVGGTGRAGGGVRPAADVVGGAVELATLAEDVNPVCVPIKRPLGDSFPSSFCSALVAAFMTVSSAPCAACWMYGRTASACCSPASCATALIAAI